VSLKGSVVTSTASMGSVLPASLNYIIMHVSVKPTDCESCNLTTGSVVTKCSFNGFCSAWLALCNKKQKFLWKQKGFMDGLYTPPLKKS